MIGGLMRGLKRAAPQEPRTPHEPPKRNKEATEASKGGDCAADVLPGLRAGAGVREAVRWMERTADTLRQRPFGLRPTRCQWGVKRRLYSLMADVVAAAERGADARKAAAALVDQLVCSGYATTALDRCKLVELGAWKPAIGALSDRHATDIEKAAAVTLYVYFVEHVSFYEDFSGCHADFWSHEVFLSVLHEMPRALTEVPESIEVDEWEHICADLEAALKCVGCFMIFWINEKSEDKFNFDISELMPFLDSLVRMVAKFDAKFGSDMSAKSRGDLLEEMVKLAGVLTQFHLTRFDETSALMRRRLEEARRQAGLLLNFLVQVLMLPIPTCVQKADNTAPGNGAVPVDERQLDSEWLEGLLDHCQGEGQGDAVKPELLAALFKTLVGLPLEEQKYRLECASPLVPPFVGAFSEQLKQNIIPPELADLKAVMNAVLQDDTAVTSDLLEEISFYPCLLDFATKRATIHAVCERQKLQGSSSDPVRLVVPRDNVLDGVCNTLNLQNQSARIDVPLEIEFRSGYADDTGNELVDEGEDQGGLRRQWLDRASRYFITSDLFTSPAQDAAHLEAPNGPAGRLAKAIIVPSPESVCSYVQEDWQEQFELFGCILGFAILYKETIPVHFGHNFLRSVFGLKTDTQDLLPLLENVDKTLHTKLKWILDGGYRELGETLEDALEQCHLPRVFALDESSCPGLVQKTPLKENGENIRVTETNKEEFVLALLDRLLISGVARQVGCFRRGLLRVVPEHIVQRIAELMSVKEIELMLCGSEEIDVEDWRTHTQYENGYTNDSKQVLWFWDAVRRMSQASRVALLSFATGSSQVPSGGFRFLQPELFTIQRVAVTDRYPEAHTCANTLDLPVYDTPEELEKRLNFAIHEAGDGFGRR